jgi:hypothetical protein
VRFDALPPAVRERLSDEPIDELLAGTRTEEEIVGPGGLLADLTRPLVRRALSADLTEHLGYEPHQEPHGGIGNARNGTTPKTLVPNHRPMPIKTARDRNGTFEPQIMRKGQRRFQGFDDKILALYSRGAVGARHRGARRRDLRREGRPGSDQPRDRRVDGCPRLVAATAGRHLPGGTQHHGQPRRRPAEPR